MVLVDVVDVPGMRIFYELHQKRQIRSSEIFQCDQVLDVVVLEVVVELLEVLVVDVVEVPELVLEDASNLWLCQSSTG